MYDQRIYQCPFTGVRFVVVLYLDNSFAVKGCSMDILKLIKENDFDYIDDFLESFGCVQVGHI